MATEDAAQEKRHLTRSKVYHCVYDATDGCTKQSLVQSLGLSLPTIYQNLSELMDAGLVRSTGELRSTGGRRAQNFAAVPDARIAVGVSITEQSLRMVVTDLRLKEIAYRRVPHVPLEEGDAFFSQLAQEIEQLLDDCHADRSRLLGVGVALAGVLSADRTCVLMAPTLPLQSLDLARLAAHIPYPVFVENDATSGGCAEVFMRESKSNLAYLTLENGVGGAVLLAGQLYTGDHGRSGEFGHMCVEPGGLPCRCGKRGCLEAYCSALRISRDLGVTLPAFFDGLSRHVPEYEILWHDLLRHLAIGAANIHMALDCDVVLGGFLSEYLPPYLPLLREYVAANSAFSGSAEHLQLSVLRRHAVPCGAALHFVKDFLDTI